MTVSLPTRKRLCLHDYGESRDPLRRSTAQPQRADGPHVGATRVGAKLDSAGRSAVARCATTEYSAKRSPRDRPEQTDLGARVSAHRVAVVDRRAGVYAFESDNGLQSSLMLQILAARFRVNGTIGGAFGIGCGAGTDVGRDAAVMQIGIGGAGRSLACRGPSCRIARHRHDHVSARPAYRWYSPVILGGPGR